VETLPPRRIPTLVLVAAIGGGLASLAALAFAIQPTQPGEADIEVARSLQRIDFPGWRAFIDLTEFLSRAWVVGTIGLASAAGFAMQGQRLASLLMLLATSAWIPKLAINELVARERPSGALIDVIRGSDGFAFPSGHTTGAVVIFGTLALILLLGGFGSQRQRVVLASVASVLIAGAAIGRVVLGAHWPSDVLGALLLGGVWLTALAWLFARSSVCRTGRPDATAQGARLRPLPDRAPGAIDEVGTMRRPDRVDLYLTFLGALVMAFLGTVVFGIGDWAGVWS
jgi:undecaprenyl-diphosphatase